MKGVLAEGCAVHLASQTWRLVGWSCLVIAGASCAHAIGAYPDPDPPTVATTPDLADAGVEPTPKEDAGEPPADSGPPTPPPHDAAVPPQKDAAPPPDAAVCAKVPPSNVCGLGPQCGCGATGTCDVTGTSGETACVIPAGTLPLGTSCTETAGCQQGLTCRYGQVCHAFCGMAGGSCAAGTACIQVRDGADAGVPNLKVCEIKCDLQDASSCGSGAACFASPYTPGATDCYPVGTSVLNAACSYTNDCAAGLGCISVGTAAATCKSWCRVGTNDCNGSVMCIGFSPQYILNNTQYGFCP